MSDNLRHEERKMRLENHLSFLQQLLTAKSGSLPIISSVSAAILVIATFNQNLIPINLGVKLCLVVLLAVIPISLIFFLLEMSFAIENTKHAIEDVVGTKIDIREKNFCEKLRNWFLYFTPFILSLLITIPIMYFIILIIHGM